MWKSDAWYEVAIWWPKDGAYGGSERARTEEQARALKEQDERLHYNVPGISEVHIRKVTVEVIQ